MNFISLYTAERGRILLDVERIVLIQPFAPDPAMDPEFKDAASRVTFRLTDTFADLVTCCETVAQIAELIERAQTRDAVREMEAVDREALRYLGEPKPEVDDGRFTGKAVEVPCGREKWTRDEKTRPADRLSFPTARLRWVKASDSDLSRKGLPVSLTAWCPYPESAYKLQQAFSIGPEMKDIEWRDVEIAEAT